MGDRRGLARSWRSTQGRPLQRDSKDRGGRRKVDRSSAIRKIVVVDARSTAPARFKRPWRSTQGRPLQRDSKDRGGRRKVDRSSAIQKTVAVDARSTAPARFKRPWRSTQGRPLQRDSKDRGGRRRVDRSSDRYVLEGFLDEEALDALERRVDTVIARRHLQLVQPVHRPIRGVHFGFAGLQRQLRGLS